MTAARRVCSVETDGEICARPTVGRGWCRGHYLRWHRDGDVQADRPLKKVGPRGKRSNRADGYSTITAHGHPLADRKGMVLVHRLHAWGIFGPGPFGCHWCRRPISWFGDVGEKLDVDHLNGDRRVNHPSNLVMSCHGCNVARARGPAALAARLERLGGGR